MHLESPKDTLTLVVTSVLAKGLEPVPLSRLTCAPLTGSPLQVVSDASYRAIHGVWFMWVRAWTGSLGRARAPALTRVVMMRPWESCIFGLIDSSNVCKIDFVALYFWSLAHSKVLMG